jgi:hypothetical protein
MAGLVDQIEEVAASGTWVDSDARHTNSTGTPLVSSDGNGSGEAIADVYTLAFSSVIASTSATVTVSTSSLNNPYNGRTKSVNLDGTTVYDDVVPGVDLVFSASGSFTNSWAAQVRVGRYEGEFEAFGAGAGVPGTGRRHRVQNTGSGPATSCLVQIVNIAKYVRKVGTVFDFVRPHAPDATIKFDADQIVGYAITVENKAGAGAGITADIKVDGALVNVKNLTDLSTGTSEDLTVVDEYEITTGDLEGVRFKLSQSILNTATANIMIFDNPHTQIAPDSAGAAGTYGTSDVTLTESGQSSGTITASGVAYYWERTLVADGSNSVSNPRPGDLRLKGAVSEAAGWDS